MSTTVTSPMFMSKLNSRQETAEGMMAFRFNKPARGTFKPGQFVDMTLSDPLETTVKVEDLFATFIDEEFFITRSWFDHVRRL